jgi:putative transposon-encoded protein
MVNIMIIKKSNWKKPREVFPTLLVKIRPQGGGASVVVPPEYRGEYALLTILTKEDAEKLGLSEML